MQPAWKNRNSNQHYGLHIKSSTQLLAAQTCVHCKLLIIILFRLHGQVLILPKAGLLFSRKISQQVCDVVKKFEVNAESNQKFEVV